MKKVKVGIVGLGELGSVHASNLRFKIPNAELIAICGLPVEKEKLETIQSDWEIPYCFYDFEEMVNLPELEAVVISSSTAAHYEHALAAIKANKHVFIEKPTGLNEQECLAIEQAAAASDKLFTVGFMRRHDPSYAEAKRRIDAGEIGTPILFRGYSLDPEWVAEYLAKRSAKNGCWFIDMTVHDYDLARWFLQSEAETVYALGGAYAYHCKTGHPNMCCHMRTIGVDEDGAFAEYAVVPARMAVRIPASMSTETAIFAEPLNCVMGAMDKIRLLPGENVLVMGAGPIGLYFIKLLALNGAGKIFVSEVSTFRSQYAKDCGATRVINPKEEDLTQIILEETGGIGVDVTVDAVGVLLPGCLEATRCNGRILLFGNNSAARETICQADITRKELTILGSYVGPHTLPATVRLLESGKLELHHLITHRISLLQFADGLDAMRRGDAIEVVITPDT